MLFHPLISGVFKWAGPLRPTFFWDLSLHGEGFVPPINPKHPVVPCHPHPRCHLLMPWCMNRWRLRWGVFCLSKKAMDENMLIPKVWKKHKLNRFCRKKVQSETIVLELNVSIRELNFFKEKNHPLLQCLGRVQCFFISKDELGAKRGMFSSKWMGHKVP